MCVIIVTKGDFCTFPRDSIPIMRLLLVSYCVYSVFDWGQKLYVNLPPVVTSTLIILLYQLNSVWQLLLMTHIKVNTSYQDFHQNALKLKKTKDIKISVVFINGNSDNNKAASSSELVVVFGDLIEEQKTKELQGRSELASLKTK